MTILGTYYMLVNLTWVVHDKLVRVAAGNPTKGGETLYGSVVVSLLHILQSQHGLGPSTTGNGSFSHTDWFVTPFEHCTFRAAASKAYVSTNIHFLCPMLVRQSCVLRKKALMVCFHHYSSMLQQCF